MDSVYTTTITQAAQKRGIRVEILDPVLPVFALHFDNKAVRCYNGLTDFTGAASFHLAQDKGAANRFLRENGFHVPAQECYSGLNQAISFMGRHERIVIKPVSQWGGRGVSTHVSNRIELAAAITFAKRFSNELLLEECVHGVDWRLIYVDYKFVTAIQRTPAAIEGNGVDSIKKLIQKKNATARKTDPSNRIPLDKETARTIKFLGYDYDFVPAEGQNITVRRTSNYHTGGTVDIIGNGIGGELIAMGEAVAKLVKIPVLGVDILANENGHHHIIELSPDLAISPPEGYIVVEKFLDFLFPETKTGALIAAPETDSIKQQYRSNNNFPQSTLQIGDFNHENHRNSWKSTV
jgi:D-alanine-D-alanine ligase-like ATP-grasp enzyme